MYTYIYKSERQQEAAEGLQVAGVHRVPISFSNAHGIGYNGIPFIASSPLYAAYST